MNLHKSRLHHHKEVTDNGQSRASEGSLFRHQFLLMGLPHFEERPKTHWQTMGIVLNGPTKTHSQCGTVEASLPTLPGKTDAG